MSDHVTNAGEDIHGQRRVFLIVLDSFGIGRQPDAADFGDEGSNTLSAIATSTLFQVPHLCDLGLFSIDSAAADIADRRVQMPELARSGLFPLPEQGFIPAGSFGRLQEASMGKDTTIGHWEIAGIISNSPLPVYPDGFPPEVIRAFEERTGRRAICNRPYSGTDVIRDYGREHMETGALIVYTSADSVFQIAAHEVVVPIDELYRYCEIARELLQGTHAVGRVIARPFEGAYPNFKRTSRRHDYSLPPPSVTMLDLISGANQEVIGVGKINDIFAGRGLTRYIRTTGNADGIEKTMTMIAEPFAGLCFINLVDFDMLYGHRNDIDGYAKAMSEFDLALGKILPVLSQEDLLIITADHGCDPSTPSTDHSRESVPVLFYGSKIRSGVDLGTGTSFADVAATVVEYLGIKPDLRSKLAGVSVLPKLM
jgi:phosphopentomutase